ncbi:MAG: restriction endonuclease [Ignavibacteria bacterium]|nr:restriction endonuclease [Ignavibacteria bacterium]
MVIFINQLNKRRTYPYLNPTNKGLIRIENVTTPEGPIYFKRFNPSKGEIESNAKTVSISTQQIWRLANSIRENYPVNVERIFGGSYNSRSVLESLLCHTPQFYFCFPGRIQSVNGYDEVKKGHKHILWKPDLPHRLGEIKEIKTDIVISEIPQEVTYEKLEINFEPGKSELENKIKRRHSQIQIALMEIGVHLGFRTWVANNDKGIIYDNKRLVEYDSVINDLNDERLISVHPDAIKQALLIDCIWFKNGKLMPAVMEIEHSTGVTSGLDRMLNLNNMIPSIKTRYVIVANDDDRNEVIKKSRHEQYKKLEIKYFSYSAVEELYYLCKKREIKGITEEFLDSFMEPIMH